MLRGLLFLLCLAAVAPAAGATDVSPLRSVWPAEPAAAAVEERTVTIASASPYSLDRVGTEEAPQTILRARLFEPAATPPPQGFPAVVLIHGASGVREAREITYGRQFASMGVSALVIDSFTPRRDMASGFEQRLLNITETMLISDVYAGLRWLARRPSVDPDRIALIGFSYGAMVTVFAAYEQVAELLAPEGQRFAAHAAFYGPCVADFDDERATGAPVLMLLGGRDEITRPERCEEVAQELRRGGSEVELIVLEGAYHQWDGGWPGPRRIGRSLADCRFRVDSEGVARDSLVGMAMTNPAMRRVVLGLCSDSDGYLIGADEAVRARSNSLLGAFLAEAFAKAEPLAQ